MKAGKLRALAVGSERRNALLPDVPAIAETLPGFVATTWAGMVAPPGTPPAIVEKLSAALAEAMRQPDIQKQLAESFTDAVGSTPSEFAILLRQERDRWGKVVRATGARAD